MRTPTTTGMLGTSFFACLIMGTSAVMCSFPSAAASPFKISSPVNGAIVAPGQTLAITVTIVSGTYPNGMAVLGQHPLGTVAVQSVVGSSVAFSLAIPANTSPGIYTISALANNSGGALIASAPVSVDVERLDAATSLLADPASITMESIGSTRPFTVLGTFPGGQQLDITQSSLLTATSENPSVATAKSGTLTAVGSGQTNVDVQYGQITIQIRVTVP